MRPSHITWVLCSAALICLGCVYVATVGRREIIPDAATVAGSSAIGGPFQLTNQDGIIVNEKSWSGKFLLLYFGFTHCPDVCPLGLNKIAEAYHLLTPTEQAKVQPIFITVDPERDTPAELKTYMALYDTNMIGLTGSIADIGQVKSQFKVYAEKQGTGADYMVNHSSFTYLLDSQGRLARLFTHDATAAEMASGIKSSLAGI